MKIRKFKGNRIRASDNQHTAIYHRTVEEK